jgi:predicted NBD/HSP70 family sugar kinase
MANQALVKRINRARVLDAIRRQRPLSRSVLADLVGLDRKSITNLVGELLREGLVEETGAVVRTGRGRPLIMLTLRVDTYWVGGMAIQADEVSGVLLDVGGERRWTVRLPLAPSADLAAVLAAVRGVYAELRGAGDNRVRGVGVAVPGILDVASGLVRRSVNLPALEGVALREVLGSAIQEPLFLEESSRAKALAEKWFGLAREVSSFVCVDLGIGIGAGLVQDRRPYVPAGGYAGEIGHVIVEPGGPLCRCGHRGCLEACISERVLVERINGLERQAYGRLDDVRDLGRESTAVLQEAGYRLGLALAYLANIICPPLIVLNGPLMRFAEVVMPALERGLGEGALADCRDRVRLAVSTLPDAAACGAAARALAEVYEVDGHVQV